MIYRDLRLQAKLTQAELGALMGVATQYVQMVESGRRNPKGITRRRYAKALAKPLKSTPAQILAQLEREGGTTSHEKTTTIRYGG